MATVPHHIPIEKQKKNFLQIQKVLGIRVCGESKLRKKKKCPLFFECERRCSMFASGPNPIEGRKRKPQKTMGGISEVVFLSGQERTRSSVRLGNEPWCEHGLCLATVRKPSVCVTVVEGVCSLLMASVLRVFVPVSHTGRVRVPGVLLVKFYIPWPLASRPHS